MPRAVEAALRARLLRLVAERHVLVDADLTAGYERDVTGLRRPAPRVVRPGTPPRSPRSSRVREAGAPVVPQGGNTGLVGGQVPRGGEVVLSTRASTPSSRSTPTTASSPSERASRRGAARALRGRGLASEST